MKKRSSLLRRIVLFPIAIYGLVTAFLLLIQGLIGERWTVVAFLNTFAQILWLPALLSLPFVLLMRAGRTALLLIPAALAWIVTFGDHFVPKAPLAPTANQATFTFATFNLYDQPRDTAGIVSIVKEMNADVVALQELNISMSVALERELGAVYPYRAMHRNEGRYRGMGVMSKYPITNDLYWHYTWMPTDLGHQRVQIDLNGQTLTLFNLHPVHPGVIGKGFDPSWRTQEITVLLEETRAYQPVMMAGDFNMPELSEDYARITQGAGFKDAYRTRGWGLGHTFTHHVLPFLRLDYMFLGNGVDVGEIRVWPTSGGSDHLPILATLVLKP